MIKLEKPYPLYKLVQEEEPDIRHGGYNTSYTIYVKVQKEANWFQLYTTFSKNWAELALQRLKELFDTQIYRWLALNVEPIMFEVNDQIYKTKYIFPDHSSICGDTIAGNQRYGEFSVEPVKFDYLYNIIFFYYRGDCLLKCNQLFLNGELIMNSQKLDEICKDIGQDKGLLDSSPDKLLKYMANNYDCAKTFTCNGYTCYDITDYK